MTPSTMNSQLLSQIHALSDGALYADLSDRTQIEVSGPDAVKFLHNFVSQEVQGLQVGQGAETFFCDVRGKTIGHGYLFRLSDSIVYETVPGQAESLLAHLDRYLIMEDVQLIDRTSEWGLAAVIGPGAERCVTSFGEPPSDQPLGSRMLPNELELRRVTLHGPPALHLRFPRANTKQVMDALIAAGAEAANAEMLELLRIVHGQPRFASDIQTDNLPQEIDRNEQAISFVKGCYLGQETVARIDALGHVNWKLVGVRGPAEAKAGLELTKEGKRVGAIRSTAATPAGDSVALALVRQEHAHPDRTLQSEIGDFQVEAFPMVFTKDESR